MRFALVAAAAAGFALVPMRAAHAQGGVEPSIPEGPATSGADLRKAADASVDRNFLTPTAETVRAGDITFNSYELFLAGLTVGITDRIQVSATGLLPITKDVPLIVNLTAKGQILAWDHLRFSVQPGTLIIRYKGDQAGLAGVQLLLDYIIDDGGRFVLSFAEGNHFAWGTFGEGSDLENFDVIMGGIGATASAQLGSFVKLIAEFTMPGGYHDRKLTMIEEATLLTYGVRFFGPHIAADLAFVRPLYTDALPMGWPMVTFSARF